MQVPIVPGRLHDLHGPVQAVAQHTPWAQKPLLHSSLLPQGAPPPGRRHTPSWHTPNEHSGSAVQKVMQLFGPHL
jgi:hypothetical protein